MPEPTSSAIAMTAATATGLTLFGVATGLHPAILLAGMAGGLWALSYQEPSPIWKRVAVTVMASILAGYLTPAVAAGVTAIGNWPQTVTHDMVQLPIAVLIGLLAHRVLGPALMRFAAQKAEEASK
jgi:hypothetical protein